jgi:hypothetical protein
VLYGESNLPNGQGHLKTYNVGGVLSSEGDIANGLAEGMWTFYAGGGSRFPDGIEHQVPYSAGVPGSGIASPPFNPSITWNSQASSSPNPSPNPSPQPTPTHNPTPTPTPNPSNPTPVAVAHGYLWAFTSGTDGQIGATAQVINGATGKTVQEHVAPGSSNVICATTLERVAWGAGLSATLTGPLGATVRIVSASGSDKITVSGAGCAANVTQF